VSRHYAAWARVAPLHRMRARWNPIGAQGFSGHAAAGL